MIVQLGIKLSLRNCYFWKLQVITLNGHQILPNSSRVTFMFMWLTLSVQPAPEPPENCHLNVKKCQKT